MQSRPLQDLQFRIVRFGAFEVDAQTSELRRAGVRVKIDQRSFQILLLLLKNGGELVTREELRQNLWSADTLLDFDRNLNKAISKLRSVLGDSAEKPRFIETLQNRGYRLIATLAFPEPEAAASTNGSAPEAIAESGADEAQVVSGVALFGPFELDFQTRELRKRGALVNIHQQPLQILLLLLKRHGQLVGREEMCNDLWPPGTHVGFERSLNKAVFKLREALGDSVEHPLFVETMPGRGYRFISPVRFVDKASEALRNAELVESQRNASVQGIRQESEILKAALVDAQRKSRWAYYAAVSLVMVLSAMLYVHFRASKVAASAEHRSTRTSVAILDFKNLSGEPREAWLSTALSEWISTELDAGGQLRIIPSQRVAEAEMELHIANGDLPSAAMLAQLRKMLGTDFVLSGSYGTLGNGAAANIRVDLFLQDASSAQTIASVSQTGLESNLFAVVSHTGSELRSHMGIREVSHEEAQQVASMLSANPEAIRLYSEGLHRLRVFDALAAIDPLQRAVVADPNDALAHDALATAWSQLGYDTKARVEAQKAFDLSANLPRAQRLLVEGRYQETAKHWDRAIQIYRALFEFFPDNLEYGLQLAGTQNNSGQPKDALITIEGLKKLPGALGNDPRIDIAEAHAALGVGDMKRALASTQLAHKKAVALHASLLLARAEIVEGWVLWNLNQLDAIPALMQDARQLFAAAGDTAGVAEVFHQEGMDARSAGDAKGAEEDYEKALVIFRRIGLMKGVGVELLCIGEARLTSGDLTVAKEKLDQALIVHQQVNDEDGIAFDKTNLGAVLFASGDHVGARKMYQEALAIFDRHGDPRRAAMVMTGVGEVLRVEGSTDEALAQEKRAIQAFKDAEDRDNMLWAQLSMSRILMSMGRLEEVVRSSRETTDGLVELKDMQGREMAGALLAEALGRQGKLLEARKVLSDTKAILDSSHAESSLSVAFADGIIQASSVSVGGDKAEAERMLQKVVADASRMGFANYVYEARLELAELEQANGNHNIATGQLKTLLRDAQHKGFGLIAQRASQDLTSNLIARK